MSEAKLGIKNPMFGKHLSEESKAKFRASRAGYRHSQDTRAKLSNARKRYLTQNPEAITNMIGEHNPMHGKNGPLNPMFGKHLSIESREKLSKSKLGKYDKEKNPFFGKHHSEETKRKLKEKWIYRTFAQKNNKLEKRFQYLLQKNNIKFTTHESIIGRPDIFIQPNICIFVDGCYWHGCKCKFNMEQQGQHSNYIKSRMQHDLEINKNLTENGFAVLRFWEHEIKNNQDICIEKVIGVLK